MKLKVKLEVKINNKLRSTAGQAVWNINKDKYVITLHPELKVNNAKKHKSLVGTINHEVIHILTLLSDNNNTFKLICDKLNIEKYHKNNFSTKEEYKYRIYCTECGKTTRKYKRKGKVIKNIQNYYSTCCKADIKVEKIT